MNIDIRLSNVSPADLAKISTVLGGLPVADDATARPLPSVDVESHTHEATPEDTFGAAVTPENVFDGGVEGTETGAVEEEKPEEIIGSDGDLDKKGNPFCKTVHSGKQKVDGTWKLIRGITEKPEYAAYLAKVKGGAQAAPKEPEPGVDFDPLTGEILTTPTPEQQVTDVTFEELMRVVQDGLKSGKLATASIAEVAAACGEKVLMNVKGDQSKVNTAYAKVLELCKA